MKVNKLISEIHDTCKGFDIDDGLLLRWLSELEERLTDETNHNYEETVPFSPITDTEADLFIPDKYADVYRYFLFMKIYLSVGDYERYNQFAELYAVALNSFKTNQAVTLTSRHKSFIY